MKSASTLLAILLLTACGTGAIPCTVTLTGAIEQTGTCSIIIANDGVTTGFKITSSTAFLGGIDLPNELQPGDLTDAQFVGLLATTGTNVWIDQRHHTDPANFPDQGDFTLHFASVGTKTGHGYAHASGTLRVTMPADSSTGASGTVIATVNFADTTSPDSSGSGGGSGGSGGGDSTGGGSGGGNGGGSGGSGGGGGSCTAVISGAQSHTVMGCSVGGATQSATQGTFFLNFQEEHAWAGGMSLEFSQGFSVGTFTTATPVAKGNSHVLVNEMAQWEAIFDPTMAASNLGTFTLTVSSIGPEAAPGVPTFLEPHGTVSATLKPFAGNTSTQDVTLNVTF